MTTPPSTPPPHWEASIIPVQPGGVTALCVYSFLAALVGLVLRLVFVYRFPASTGDGDMYLQLARNWADHHVYGLSQYGHLAPTDLRTPGYPAFLAVVGLVFRRSTRAILLSQATLDIFTCFLTAALAGALAPTRARRRVWLLALWLAASCPFVANYSAVVLTEVLATFLTTVALILFALSLRQEPARWFIRGEGLFGSTFALALLGALLTGLATLVRPEMPLLLGAAILVYALRGWRALGTRKMAVLAGAMVGAFLLPLLPWFARNLITLRKIQLLAPRYTTLPSEYPPVGYYSWTGTWLERYRDVYLSVWKIGEEPVDMDDLPAAAFDTPAEKARIANLFAQYNSSPTLDISPELDAQFAEIARERTRRHPLRTYLRVPFERALTIWFTPRTELLPIDGKFWPLRDQWQDSHADVLITGAFAALGYLYVALAAGGIWAAWHAASATGASNSRAGPNLWGIGLFLAYLLVRTAFLTTVEAPEPRYVISCYSAVLALAALVAIRNRKHEDAV